MSRSTWLCVLDEDKFKELDDVQVLPHPVYDPDVALADHGFFLTMQTPLNAVDLNHS
ncbi:hypothetical protein KIN20_021115 [Parelaphostrongylus tenuis]|uniref:Uncharacterized protein n=1 Tax=Parelaphostrongylus tenuis TaxID=148309 RepID=A0AAD5MS88_PARTN|nr:hypothetical protein KIN20_021115 [Parelaphostrongylus tenuis]